MMVLGGGGYKYVYGRKFAKISVRYVWDKYLMQI